MSSELPSIVIFVPWFGDWPPWMRFFLESCRWNPTINWILVGDGENPDDLPPNVRVKRIAFEAYREFVSSRLKIDCKWTQPYKVCDLRPAFGELHSEDIDGFEFWGYGDLDVIYGNIRNIYTKDVLSYDVISTHPDILAGHFTIVRNSHDLNCAFRRVRGWRGLLARKEHRGFDEYQFSHLFSPVDGRRSWPGRLLQRIRSPYLGGKVLLEERFSTDLWPRHWIDGTRNYPRRWYWRHGSLTAEGAGDREFLYVHFTHWQSNRWTEGKTAPWKQLSQLDQVPLGRALSFSIGPDGFHTLA